MFQSDSGIQLRADSLVVCVARVGADDQKIVTCTLQQATQEHTHSHSEI